MTRHFALALTLALLTVLTLAGFAEIGLRIAFARSLDFGMEMWKYAVTLKQPVADPQLSFVHAPSRRAFLMGVDVAISSQGLRDREYALARTPGTYRILMLGDSTTFGWGVRAEDTVAKLLEAALNHDTGRRFEVINAGVGNYDTVQEVTYYRQRGRAFHPDLVILEYFINDAEPVPREDAGFLRKRSYFAAFFASRSDGILRVAGQRPDWRGYYASLYDDAQPGWRAAQAALGDLARTARGDGAAALVALLPELHQINDDYPFAQQHALVRAAAARYGMPSLELIDSLRGHPEPSLWVTPLDDHPNATANRLIAAQMERWITTHQESRN